MGTIDYPVGCMFISSASAADIIQVAYSKGEGISFFPSLTDELAISDFSPIANILMWYTGSCRAEMLKATFFTRGS